MLLRVFFIVSLCAFLSCSKDTPAPNFDEQLIKDLVSIDSYLKSNNINAQSDPDNYIRYVVNSQGLGNYPTYMADSITVTYNFQLLPSQTQVQAATTPVRFLLGDLIPGWQIGLPLINEGARATFYIPSGLGYGTTGTGSGANSVPPNSNLIYEIQLLKVVPQLKKDTIAVNSFLKSNSISNVITDPSGFKYVISTLGTGPKPTLDNSITFSYSGKLLSSGVIFEQSSSPVSAQMKSFTIKGFQLGMLRLPQGSKATFYIPSVLGYGLRSSQTIPRNANLIFEVELVSIN